MMMSSKRRNELIARYIKLRTGKTRTRKQVSSHIQVLARRKLREFQAKMKVQFWQPGLQPSTSQDVKPFAQAAYGPMGKTATAVSDRGLQAAHPWEGRAIATHKFRLVEYSAYLELRVEESYHKHLFVHIGDQPAHPLLESVEVKEIYDKFPQKAGGLKELYEKGPSNSFFLVKFWADLNTNIASDAGAFYGVSSHYESNDNMVITCSTKVCSFGKQVVEKVETEYSRFENGRYVYRISRSPMCDYMINFINKLKHLPEKYMMNSVLENFTILQVSEESGCGENAELGRNELIARYIKLRTGKTRTRKQVSSHIQVLARRKLREFQAKMKVYHKHLFVHIGDQPAHPLLESVEVKEIYDKFPQKAGGLKELYEKGPSNSFFLVKFWADLNTNIASDAGAFYGVSSHYESNDNMVITCSTKVCSFGKQVVEKVETEYSRFENGRYVYRISRSPMCDYMINFINKLKHLPEKYMMNSVLENFTILQDIAPKVTPRLPKKAAAGAKDTAKPSTSTKKSKPKKLRKPHLEIEYEVETGPARSRVHQ
ncbi:hypothetical protein quinque_014419 [Culex quinquefasciatus]